MKNQISILLACAGLVLAHACFAQSGTIITIAGIDSFGYNGDNRPAITAKLYKPETISLDKYGNVFIADPMNFRIRKIDCFTGLITTVAGSGSYGYGGDGGVATDAKLSNCDGVAVDTNGHIYICDLGNNRIRKVDASTGIITTIAGNGSAGMSGNGGPATGAVLNAPFHLHVDKYGNIFFTDLYNNMVRKIDVATGIISLVAGNGTTGGGGDGFAATSSGLNGPWGVCTDSAGNVYVTEVIAQKIRKVSALTGLLSTVAGNGISGAAGDSGPATAAQLNGPCGIFLDTVKNIFFADQGNSAVRRIDHVTGIITTIAGTLGVGGFGGDNGPATAAKLGAPSDIKMDRDGNLIICDRAHRIRKVCYDTMCLKIPTDTSHTDTPSHVNTINTITTTQHYQLTPNPTSGDITLTQAEADNDAVTIDVRDIVGKSVYTSAARFRDRTCHLSLEHLSPGLYFMRIRDSKERVYNVRFVVQ